MNVAHYLAGVSSCFDEPRSSLFKSLSRWKVGLSLQVKKNVRHSIYYCWIVIWGAVRGIHHQAVLLEVMDVRIAKPITKTSPWANNLQDGGERHDQAPNQIIFFRSLHVLPYSPTTVKYPLSENEEKAISPFQLIPSLPLGWDLISHLKSVGCLSNHYVLEKER